MTREERAAAIAEATSEAELDALWYGWEAIGWSRDGLLYAEVLARKVALGATLGAEDRARLDGAAAKEQAGKDMPPVTGDLTLGRA